jgi:hypothetical protein
MGSTLPIPLANGYVNSASNPAPTQHGVVNQDVSDTPDPRFQAVFVEVLAG